MRIALDAMGGDSAPASTVRGAVMAAKKFPEVEIVLVGERDRIEAELEQHSGYDGHISVVHAPEVVGMNELPVEGLRSKPNSSIRRGVALVAEGEADAIVSAGNTGAAVVAATLALRLIEGVRRPGIAVTFRTPNEKGLCTVIDVGANIKCRPIHLLQYSTMATVYNRLVHKVREPVVGLLNIGEENEKGNELVKETHALLTRSTVNFLGNVEGRDIYDGGCDVVVCEGFVGNVILKVTEGLSQTLLMLFKREANKRLLTRLGIRFCRGAIDRLRQENDFAEYGGAPLLGVDGILIVCHGRSDAKAIKNAIGAAVMFGKYQVNDRIKESIQAQQSRFSGEV